MSIEEACATVRARWDHPPLDPHDVAERVAARLVDCERAVETLVVAHLCACRVFVRAHAEAKWLSRYVHSLGEVDGVLDGLLARLDVRRAA